MNWDAIGAVAELLAAVAVIFSFIYLARQIRQSTRAQKRSNLREIAEDHTTTLRCTATDPELASLVLKGHTDLSSLDAVERYRFDSFFYAWLSSLERALLDARDGEYPEVQYSIRLRSPARLRSATSPGWIVQLASSQPPRLYWGGLVSLEVSNDMVPQ